MWYSLTSPQFLDSGSDRLKELAVFLREQIETHPVANDFAPALYWCDVVDRLIESYPNARSLLSMGEISVMRDWCIKALGLGRGFREQGMWMDQQDFRLLLAKIEQISTVCSSFVGAIIMAHRFLTVGEADWKQYSRDDGYRGSSILDHLDKFEQNTEIPEYFVDQSVKVGTGEVVPWTGVWIPVKGVDSAALAFAVQGQVMQPMFPITKVDENGYEHTSAVEVEWFPVKPTGRMLPSNSSASTAMGSFAAGSICDRSGYWFTPASSGSRCYFKQGQAFPEIEGSSYGATFWQWSPDQSDPKL